MRRTSITYLQDILYSADKVEEFVSGMTYEQFVDDEKTQYAVIRAIEIIGEATKNVTHTIRDKHPSIPWKDIAGMRDKLIHSYFGVDIEILWVTAKNNVPGLIPLIEKVLLEESEPNK